jgi:subtilisin-like proprotein convertase family protein
VAGTLGLLVGGAGAATFTNLTPIAIPDSGAANPYPSTISVSTEGRVVQARATLHSYNHTNPDDLDVLLVAPGGAATLLMADTCGGLPVTGLTFTFDDAALTTLPDSQPCVPSGTYRPVDYFAGDPGDPFPSVPGTFAPPGGPYVASLSALTGASAGGQWNLFVNDDAAVDTGSFAGGWTLELLTDKKCSGKVATAAAHLGTGEGETIVGTPGKDVLIGLGRGDTLKGMGGNDVICGGSGADKIKGGAGKDTLLGEGGKDKLSGQGGKDVCKGGPKADTAASCEKEKSI